MDFQTTPNSDSASQLNDEPMGPDTISPQDNHTVRPGSMYADALVRQQQQMKKLGDDPKRYDAWAAREQLRLETAVKSLRGDTSEKLKAEAWAVRMMLNQYGLQIRRDTQQKLEGVLHGILPPSDVAPDGL